MGYYTLLEVIVSLRNAAAHLNKVWCATVAIVLQAQCLTYIYLSKRQLHEGVVLISNFGDQLLL